MQGLGNDFIILDAINQRLENLDFAKLSQDLCDRNFGVGADGLILVLTSEQCDFKMRIFNADGSEPEMCGNGIRCFSRFVYEQKLTEKDVFSVETLAGTIVPALIIQDGEVNAVEVDMGKPVLAPTEIPVKNFSGKNVIAQPLEIAGQTFTFTAVSMGNPHAIFLVDDLKRLDIDKFGPLLENHPYFPNRTNVEFVQILSRNEAILIVWERGAGKTLACGTGACASVVAGILNQQLDRKVVMHLPGGDLSIEWQKSDDHVIMNGAAETVFKGEIEYS
jgi:diaminopimelate epimerase